MIISHLYKDCNGDWIFQSNEEHSRGVAKLAESFASKFGMSSWGRILGLLHDKGKEQHSFQRHIMQASGYKPDIQVTGDYNHAYIGGIIAHKLYGNSADNFFVNQIVSHHTGLHDSCDLAYDLEKGIPPEVNTVVEKIQLSVNFQHTPEERDWHHISRLLFSCLVDADFLDTEAFMNAHASRLRGSKTNLKELLRKLTMHLANLKEHAKATEVNLIRDQIQQQCLKMSNGNKGFYSLTVPTGGGKTLSSLVWAMNHAIINGQDRIIIAIPYTSIIVQTAAILKGIFGEDNVLEHHSNVNPEEIEDDILREKMSLATENWDYPIIVTTNVQLFESLYSNKPSSCRKLHNIVNSVIVLDEVQTLPTDYLQPIIDSLKTYQRIFNVSVLFTTASQPVLSGLIQGCNPHSHFQGIDNITEIIPPDFKLHEKLRRVELNFDNMREGLTYDEIAEQLERHKRVLCIVNTRQDAREIFNRLPKEGITLHLSRMMCPDHVKTTIEMIRDAIANENNSVVRVVSTQLVEAGVDIDFPVVYRQEAGLDSILQAAGRCNREGKFKICTTYVFSLSKEHALPQGFMRTACEAIKSIPHDDWFAPSAMNAYFRQLYCRQESFDKEGIARLLYHTPNKDDLLFKTAAEAFHLIEDSGFSIIVCWKDSMKLIAELEEKGPSYQLMKKLGKYCVNVHKHEYDALMRYGVIKELPECQNLSVIKYKEQYDERTGLRTDNSWANRVLTV